MIRMLVQILVPLYIKIYIYNIIMFYTSYTYIHRSTRAYGTTCVALLQAPRPPAGSPAWHLQPCCKHLIIHWYNLLWNHQFSNGLVFMFPMKVVVDDISRFQTHMGACKTCYSWRVWKVHECWSFEPQYIGSVQEEQCWLRFWGKRSQVSYGDWLIICSGWRLSNHNRKDDTRTPVLWLGKSAPSESNMAMGDPPFIYVYKSPISMPISVVKHVQH